MMKSTRKEGISKLRVVNQDWKTLASQPLLMAYLQAALFSCM